MEKAEWIDRALNLRKSITKWGYPYGKLDLSGYYARRVCVPETVGFNLDMWLKDLFRDFLWSLPPNWTYKVPSHLCHETVPFLEKCFREVILGDVCEEKELAKFWGDWHLDRLCRPEGGSGS